MQDRRTNTNNGSGDGKILHTVGLFLIPHLNNHDTLRSSSQTLTVAKFPELHLFFCFIGSFQCTALKIVTFSVRRHCTHHILAPTIQNN